jgi:hypothetical protein
MKTIIIFTALLCVIFANKAAFGGYKLVKDETESLLLHQALDAARPQIQETFTFDANVSLTFVAAYQKLVNGMIFQLIHAVRENETGEIKLIKTQVSVGPFSAKEEDRTASVQWPEKHTADATLTADPEVDAFEPHVKALLPLDESAHVHVTEVKIFPNVFKNQTYYVVTARVTYAAHNGGAVVTRQFVFNKSGEGDFEVKKEITFE